ncbi:MAG: hypothetical protein ACRCRW_01240 [Aeromonadaceae bacterium]
MKKIALCVLATLSVGSVYAGSLDVYGDIKVNGKTVINANGELTGNAANTIPQQDYLNSNGLKKTFKTQSKYTSNSSSEIVNGLRIDDYSIAGVSKYTYITYDKEGKFQSSWVSEEVYETPLKWSRKGYSANEDGSATGTWYSSEQFVRTWLSAEEPQTVALNGVYMKQYQDVVSSCGSSEPTCAYQDPITNNTTELVTVLGKMSYKSGDVAYDDCMATQYNNSSLNGGNIWTAIHCKGVGLVKGWNSNYTLDLTKVEGTLKPASKSARSRQVLGLVTAPR